MNEKLSSPKIEITAEKVKTYLGVFSVCFLISGILYNYIYLGFFGIEISKFFTFQDYLSSSIEKLLLNFVVLSILILCDTSLLSRLSTESQMFRGRVHDKRNKRPVLRFIIVMSIIIAFIVISVIQIQVRKNPNGFYTMAIGVSLGISFLVTLGHGKYLQRPRRAFFVLMLITCFLTFICADALYDVATIRSGDISKIKKYTIVFDEKLDINESGLVLLGTSSNYYFLYDKISNNTRIIPSQSVVSISTKKKY
ncbi:MAG: hypothetical protein MUO85_08535 [candidate division Zixibacteria bacterium]|nr:hypothetical protein [candidate division Zixibacteria bacterium]